MASSSSVILLLFILSSSSAVYSSQALLSPSFYGSSCPNALATIRTSIRSAVAVDRRMAASLLRLHFHDCFVQGCDASILLKDGGSIVSEQNAPPNKNSVRGYQVIDDAKAAVEKICPGVVSCADILTAAARDAAAAVDGPSWTVKLGRRDSTTASFALANSDLPGPTETLSGLISAFHRKGLGVRDMVALSGAHTIGQAQCQFFRERVYSNGTNIDAGFASTRRHGCPASGGNSNLAPFDILTPTTFDNNYFKMLQQKKGLLESDQVLFSGGSTDTIVNEYSRTPATFNSDFAAAMIKMSEIGVLTGSAGQIRKICSAIN